MSILPNHFREATVVIGERLGPNPIRWIATGFIVGRFEGLDANGEKKYSTYLITNKHVIQGRRVLQLQFNSTSGTSPMSIVLKSGLRLMYSEHPDPDVDVVAYQISINGAVKGGFAATFFLLDDQALTLANMKKTGVEEGSLVYALGFPTSLSDALVNNISKDPVYRLGCISRLEHMYHNKNAKCFIIDAPIYPGNSGGPVVNRPEIISIKNTPVNSSACLIGIVSAYLPYREELESTQTNRTRMITEENSGLTIVYPVDYIMDVVEIERTRFFGLQSNQKMPGLK